MHIRLEFRAISAMVAAAARLRGPMCPRLHPPDMSAGASRRSKTFRLFAGWWALALYVSASSPIGAAATAAIGALDRNHQVTVKAEAGGMCVVLRHRPRCGVHHHGVVARALTVFAHPASATDPDHVLQFNAPIAYACDSQPQAALPTSERLAHTAILPGVTVAWLSNNDFQAAVLTHAPPGDAGRLLTLRSTVLLI